MPLSINMLAIVSLALLGAVCFVLMLWCQYDDGLIGKTGLAVAGLAAGVAVIHYREGWARDYDVISAAVFFGMAIFMLRHLWRRLHRVRRRVTDARVPRRRCYDRGAHWPEASAMDREDFNAASARARADKPGAVSP